MAYDGRWNGTGGSEYCEWNIDFSASYAGGCMFRPMDSKYSAFSGPVKRNFRAGLWPLALLVGTCSAQTAAERMDKLVQPYIDSQMFMGSVLVAQHGKVLFSKSYGWADAEWKIPNTPTTKFQIASVTKQFTAASILLLGERGKLKTEDAVKKYLPDAP